jgi:hypothetical protein
MREGCSKSPCKGCPQTTDVYSDIVEPERIVFTDFLADEEATRSWKSRRIFLDFLGRLGIQVY